MRHAMRRILAAGLAAACGAGVRARAQVALSLEASAPEAMVYEAVEVRLTVRNQAGRLLSLGEREPCDARLRLTVVRDGYKQISRRDDRPLLEPTDILPGEGPVLRFNLPRLFDVRTAGRYRVQAAVEQGGVSYASPEIELTIAEGVEIARVSAGVPGADGVARTYVLMYLHKGPGEYLYLRIEDLDGSAVYGLFNMGRVVRVRQPDLRVDGAGNAHVLFQTLGGTYLHAAFTPFGVQLFARPLAGKGGRAFLEQMPSGRIEVPGALPLGAPAASNAPPPARPDAAPAPAAASPSAVP